MLSAEGTGKTIEKAIESALLELKAVREDVDIKILNEGGLFKKAKVLVTISSDAESKYAKRKALKAEEYQKEKEEESIVSVKKEEIKVTDSVKPEITHERSKNVVEPSQTESDQTQVVVRERKVNDKVIDPKVFLEGYFKALQKEVTIQETEEDGFIVYEVQGSELGEIIGHRGEAFYALNNLVQSLAGRTEKRVLIDVDNYRKRRSESLSATAKRMANKVVKTGRYMKLEPMNAAERRIVHTALQKDDTVTTLSKGSEPNRFVIIFPKEYKERD